MSKDPTLTKIAVPAKRCKTSKVLLLCCLRFAGLISPMGGSVTVLALIGGVVAVADPALAAQPTQVFGPGKVNCQRLAGKQADCLLSALRITRDSRDEATFSINALPTKERTLFRKWCLHASDECVVTVEGQRESAQATRLSVVSSLHWTRPSAPKDQAAAQAMAR